jgi:TonB family protein
LAATTLLVAITAMSAGRAEETAPADAAEAGLSPAEAGRVPRPLQGATAARLVEAGEAEYPQSALWRGREGWVDLSFVIRPDGTVGDPVIEDSSGIPELEKSALKAVMRSRYSPATLDGKPVEQCAATMRYKFVIASLPRGARRAFITEFERAQSALRTGDLAAARAIADELAERHTTNLYEDARRWVLEAQLREAGGDKAGALDAIERALSYGEKHLEPVLYRDLVVRAFWRAGELQQWSRALAMDERLVALADTAPGTPVHPNVVRAAAEIRAAIAGPQILGFPGTVGYRTGCAEGRPNWQHELLRREFAFDSVEGKVDDFELRCDWRRIRGSVNTEQAWKVPENWGWCQLFVFGEEGARVKLVEYPLEPTAPTASADAPGS